MKLNQLEDLYKSKISILKDLIENQKKQFYLLSYGDSEKAIEIEDLNIEIIQKLYSIDQEILPLFQIFSLKPNSIVGLEKEIQFLTKKGYDLNFTIGKELEKHKDKLKMELNIIETQHQLKVYLSNLK